MRLVGLGSSVVVSMQLVNKCLVGKPAGFAGSSFFLLQMGGSRVCQTPLCLCSACSSWLAQGLAKPLLSHSSRAQRVDPTAVCPSLASKIMVRATSLPTFSGVWCLSSEVFAVHVPHCQRRCGLTLLPWSCYDPCLQTMLDAYISVRDRNQGRHLCIVVNNNVNIGFFKNSLTPMCRRFRFMVPWDQIWVQGCDRITKNRWENTE